MYSTFHSGKPSNSMIKLGGPNTVNLNKMMNCTRDARDKIFTHESHKSFIGRGVPGPADYYTNCVSPVNSKHESGRKSKIPQARRDVGYTKTKIDKNVHFGVAHLINQGNNPIGTNLNSIE